MPTSIFPSLNPTRNLRRRKDFYHAIVLAHRYPPKRRFVTVSAEKFLENPSVYGSLAIGLKDLKWCHNTVLGIADKDTVKLDFDDTPFKTVKYWAVRKCSWFKLEGFIILKSSESHYHVVSSLTVSWTENVHIIAWVAVESQISSQNRWFSM